MDNLAEVDVHSIVPQFGRKKVCVFEAGSRIHTYAVDQRQECVR